MGSRLPVQRLEFHSARRTVQGMSVSNFRIQTNRYLNMWTCYLESGVAQSHCSDFRTVDRVRLLEDMANEYALTCTILAHINSVPVEAFQICGANRV